VNIFLNGKSHKKGVVKKRLKNNLFDVDFVENHSNIRS
jgi:hypothetical protein